METNGVLQQARLTHSEQNSDIWGGGPTIPSISLFLGWLLQNRFFQVLIYRAVQARRGNDVDGVPRRYAVLPSCPRLHLTNSSPEFTFSGE